MVLSSISSLNFPMISAVTFGSVMTTIGYIIIALLALMFMVVIHELGHYLAGKLFKFKILEFSIGFGPKIFSRTSKKTGEIFSIRPIPLGGFCQFEDEDEDSKSSTAFNNQPPWKRLIVLFSGALFNFVSALIIITLFFTFYGQILPSVHSLIESPDSIEQTLLQGDVILNVNNKQMNVLLPEDVSRLLSRTDETAKLKILRDGKVITIDAHKRNYYVFDKDGNHVLDKDGNKTTQYGFGFISATKAAKLSFFHSFQRSFSFGFFMVYKILAIFGQLFTGKIGLENAGGPITVISTIADASRGGFAMLMYAVCLISANLAVMNLLPLPALDGSRMVFTIIEMIFKKPVNKKVEGMIHFIGLVLLFGFAIFADVFRFIVMKQ